MAGRGDGYGPSDQTSFYAAGIPVLHLFTGAHEQYHSPDDDAATLNAEGAARIAELTAALATRVARADVTPAYARASAPPAREGDSRGYGAYLGTVPDYRAMEDETGGVLLADTRPGGPADRAGVRKGDRIVAMAGTRIENLHDMTFALQDHRPGETIDVVVVRAGERRDAARDAGRAVGARGAAGRIAPPPRPPPLPLRLPRLRRTAAGEPARGAAFGRAERAGPPAFEADRPGPRLRDRRRQALPRARGRAAPRGRPPAHVRRRKRRGLLQPRRPAAGLPGDDREGRLRPAVRARPRHRRGEAGVVGQGPHDVRLLRLAGGGPHRLRLHGGRRRRVSRRPPDRSQGYVWSVSDTYDLWEAPPEGGASRRLTDVKGYDAEATWCHRGGKLVFTSSRDGDLDLYEMDEAGQVRRLTHTPGYDGGAFYSADCSKIVWRASRPEGAELDEYRRLLAQGLVRPSRMELFVMKADGSEPRQVTRNGAANFGPYFHPDSKRIIYSSNAGESPREFDLWLIGEDGGGGERVTAAPGFDGFPMFSPDGRWLVFASNRADPNSGSTNLFIARWVE